MTEVRLLGPVGLSHRGQRIDLGARKRRFVLAVLALEANQAVSADRLVDLLWPHTPPRTARAVVHTHVSAVRRALAAADPGGAAARVLTEPAGYLLAADRESIDVHRFTDLVAEADAASSDERRVELLRRALAMWSGPALAGCCPEPVRVRLIAGLEEARLAAVEERIEAELRLGRHRGLAEELVGLCADHPHRERPVGLLMRVLHRTGRVADALAAYRAFDRRLGDELGIGPSARLQQLHLGLLRGDLDREPAATPAPAAVSAAVPVAAAIRPVGAGGVPAAPDRAGAAVATDPVPTQLPLSIPGFAGRDAELRQLDGALAAAGERPTTLVITAVSGMAGVGKTALAVHWAHRVAHRFPDGQLYVNLRGFDRAGSILSPGAAIRGFLDALHVPPHRVPVELADQAALYRTVVAGRRVLIVLDNARDAAQVRPLLPGSPGCLVLVTSRNRMAGLVAAEAARPLALDVLTGAESRDLLIERLGRGRVAAEPVATEEIIERCGRLPLALTIAAAQAAIRPRFPLAALAADLRDAGRRLDTLADLDPAADIRSVLSWSYHALGPDAARLLRLLGLHPGPDLSAAAAASLAGLPPARARAALAELTGAHVLAEPRHARYALHDLVRAYAAELTQREDRPAEQRAAVHRLLDHYLHAGHAAARLIAPHRDTITLGSPRSGVVAEPLGSHREAMAWFTVEHPVLDAALELARAEGFDVHTCQLAWTLTDYLDFGGHWADLARCQAVALDAAGRRADPAAQARAHRGVGLALARLNRLDEAERSYLQALALLDDMGDAANQARTQLNLTWICEQQGRLPEAMRRAKQALALYRAAADRAGLANALNAVGWQYALRGDHEQALRYCRQALAGHEEVADRRGQADALDSLGYAHHRLGHHGEAVACLRRAAQVFRDLGNQHDEADTLVRLGDTQHAAGDRAAARESWQRAVEIFGELRHPAAEPVAARLRALGPHHHPRTATRPGS